LAAYDPQNVYSGSNILLCMRIADASFDEVIGQESRLMTRYLLERSGQNKAEIGQFLSDYYLSYIKSLLDMASRQGGAVMSQALLDKLLETAKKHDWQLQFNLQTVLDSTNYSLKVLREALPYTIRNSKAICLQYNGPAAVEARMEEIGSQFSETIHRDVAFYGKAESDIGFSDHRKGSTG
jgi:hypothetical protein